MCDRQRFKWRMRCVALLCALAVAPLCAQEPRRTNVVVILADDQSYQDFGFLGNRDVLTPHLDQLAAQSACFVNGYVPMSVCRPSLATALTGLYPHQHGVHFNHPPPGLKAMQGMTAAQYEQTRATTDRLLMRVPTLPRILARHGYACLQTGKHWEGDYRNAGFTHGMTLGKPSARRDAISGTRQQSNGQWVAHGNGDAGLTIGRETMAPIYDFIRQQRDRPFLVWYAPFLPHAPFDAPARFQAMYAERELPSRLRKYYAEITRFDETVGQLLQFLEKEGLSDETLVVFASDNGYRPVSASSARQDDRSKLSPFEDGLRTPLLFRLPGQSKPQRYSQLVQTVDLAPTILAALGLADEITPRMPGANLWPAITGMADPPPRSAFGAIYPNDAQSLDQPSQHVRARWIRDGDFKLIVPADRERQIELSLFDLQSDPQEMTNLVQDQQYHPLVTQLRKKLDAWWSAEDDSRVTFTAQESP
ncbi:sulfatase-like hydrolase/transferase [Blastopirellula sp. J2-11]|uniref:sulfatase-like hydrolase/transferase n=1 Tax=Blastopirellula sp. J2-11 TaxID=2943192 RepID=UPI0021C9847F|nr:sulfatase-like hydrolase/transferase [Blastopirellula sp. J2-11]UUO06098.1 sulfatase-like hydrolase/transferase [Blastopirellula sp. J2-11]